MFWLLKSIARYMQYGVGQPYIRKVQKVEVALTLIFLSLCLRMLLGIFSTLTLQACESSLQFPSAFNKKQETPLPLRRSKEYCNAPGQNLSGLEGLPPDSSMQLIGVTLMVRHGDRLPISRPPALCRHPVMNLHHCHLNAHATPTHPLLYLYIETIVKHEKVMKDFLNPMLKKFDLLPDTCSDVSMTQTGIVQMLELGAFLGRRYMHFASDDSQADYLQEMVISTSRFARTFQSLLALIFGFSPRQFLKILCGGISTSSSIYFCDSDSATTPSHTKHCHCAKAVNIPRLRASFRHWDLNRTSISHLYRSLKISQECEHLVETNSSETEKIGPPLLGVTSPSRVWDWLVSEYYCAGIPLPCVPSKPGDLLNCLNSSVIEDLVNLVDANHLSMIENEDYAEAARLAMHPFLSSISEKFYQLLDERTRPHIENEKDGARPFLWIISGHDVTIGPLFIALDHPLLTKVPYGTRVAFELWANRSDESLGRKGSSVSFVRILLNGNDVTGRIGGRKHPPKFFLKPGTGSEFPTLLTLSEFDSYLKSDYFKVVNNMSRCFDHT